MSISPTALGTLLSCPSKYEKKYEQRLSPAGGGAIALDFGSAWHRILENHYQGMDPDTAFELAMEGWVDPSDAREYRTRTKLHTAYRLYRQRWAVSKLVPAEIDGRPATEWPFKVEIPHIEEPVIGIIDLTATWDANQNRGRELWFVDYKTTSRLSGNWTELYAVSNQFKAYAWAGLSRFPDAAGVLVDVAHITKGVQREKDEYRHEGCQFYRLPLRYTPYQLEQWRMTVISALEMRKIYRNAGVWPMNAPDACRMGCPYTDLCTAEDQDIADTLKQVAYNIIEDDEDWWKSMMERSAANANAEAET